jgi:hypothetical protein
MQGDRLWWRKIWTNVSLAASEPQAGRLEQGTLFDNWPFFRNILVCFSVRSEKEKAMVCGFDVRMASSTSIPVSDFLGF